jgi:hypothetical protein
MLARGKLVGIGIVAFCRNSSRAVEVVADVAIRFVEVRIPKARGVMADDGVLEPAGVGGVA